ncbi:MAG: hypothetical protein WA374_22070 [Acidobacteriaceae bacterium]
MIRRRILLILVRLVAFIAVAEALAIWVFWRSPWTPIERHYLSAYFASSLPLVGPSTVEVQWIWKVGRHQKRQLATDNDAVDAGDGIGMALSPSALGSGWKTLLESPPQQIPADQVRPYLATLAFEDQSLGDLLLFPELSALAALCASLFVWFLVVGFLRALIADYAWRRRVYSRQELLSTLSRDCTALAQRVCSGLAALYRSRPRHIETHPVATSTKVLQIQPPAKPASFPFPVFGVCTGAGKGFPWSDKDEID